jgi:site-specific DNA-methyltransferase (adenine-specific)
MNMIPISEVYNMDCVAFMREYPDKFFDLAICDPPYGIGFDGQRKSTSKHGGRREIEFKGWDNSSPKAEYFLELFRVSKNQIIWGANYYPQMLPPSMGWIFWDKGQRICNSDGELAFSSFNKALRVFTLNRTYIQEQGGGFHPTQKPVRLYDWLLKNYAQIGDKILDTHLGSGSSRIAAQKLGFDFYGCEIDEDYFNQSEKRFKEAVSMPLFDVPIFVPQQLVLV